MAALGAAGKAAGFIEKAHLNCFVAVPVNCAQLQHMAGPGLNHGHRNGSSGFVKNMSHPDLAAE
jgi:hypothetical protein